MFKSFVVLAIVASVASAGLIEGPAEQETANLLGHEKLFSGFCMESREYVLNSIRTTLNSKTSNIFTTLFNAGNDLAEEVLNVEKKAVTDLSSQLSNPSQQIEGPVSEDQIAKLIEQGRKQIQNSGAIRGIIPALKSTTQAILNAASSNVMVQLAKVRSALNPSLFISGLHESCDLLAQYEAELQREFLEAKEKIQESNPDEETQQFLSSVGLNKLRCATSSKVVRLNGFCELIKTGHQAFGKMLGINLDYLSNEVATQ